MTTSRNFIIGLAAAASLSACATGPLPPTPVEVTRFHSEAVSSPSTRGTVFVESAPAEADGALELSSYKSAVARELLALGYREGPRSAADTLVQVSVEHYVRGTSAARRSPVDVGIGGSTGTYGSGIGIGVGINLGGNRERERLGTELSVMLRDASSGQATWEGRASFEYSPDTRLVSPAVNAPILADALFRDFPGSDGQTVEIEVSE